MKTQFGRSMIEMLGVLAIIGVLSIGGIALYRRAVNNHHANTILDDVNRLAFVITEKGGYPLDSIIPKGDFKESGIYQLEAFQDLGPQQFSIMVQNVPYGVCDALLEKAAVEYVVRVNVAGSNEKGAVYDLFHTDLCHDNNDIILYFGDIDDLFDFPDCGRLPKCIRYSSDCKCIRCEEGYQLSTDNSGDPDGQYCVANSCKATGVEGCTSNEDCCKSTDFCSWGQASGCDSHNADNHGVGAPTIATGTCAPISAYGVESKDISISNVPVRWMRSKYYSDSTYGGMVWWSAQNWCKRQKRLDGSLMALAKFDDLGCGQISDGGYCPVSTGQNGEENLFYLLQTEVPKWTSGGYWLADNYNVCISYYANFTEGKISALNRYYNNGRYALCH